MSDKQAPKSYPVFVHLTIRAEASVTPTDEGMRVNLPNPPLVRADSIVLLGSDSDKWTDEQVSLMAQLVRYSAIKVAAEEEKMPEDVAVTEPPHSTTVAKGTLN